MSSSAIRAALETSLAAMTPAIDTAFENAPYTPVVGTPYQKSNLLMANPDNSVYGPSYREQGIYQVTLCYPPDVGSGDARTQADAVQLWFKRGTTLALTGNNYLTVSKTPTIGPARRDQDRYCIPVSIPFFAEIFN